MDHEKLADLIEKLATYFEAEDGNKRAVVEQHRNDTAKRVVAQVVEVLGDRLDEKTADELASNETALQLLEQMNKKAAALGGPAPSRKPKAPERVSARAAVEKASQDFADWALGRND